MKFKKHLFLLCTIIFINNCIAQNEDSKFENPFSKGKFVTDVTFHFDTRNITLYPIESIQADEKKGSAKNFSVEFDIGYSIIDNLVLGLYLEIETEKTENPTSSDFDKTNLNFYGVFTRYNFLKDEFRPFVSIHGGIGSGKIIHSDRGLDRDINITSNFGISGGFAYFFNKSFAFEFKYKLDRINMETILNTDALASTGDFNIESNGAIDINTFQLGVLYSF